jgi:ABC-2 type transport system permease protein
MKKVKRYFLIWSLLTRKTFSVHLTRKLGFFVFLTGKILRFVLFISFLFLIFRKTGGVGSYSTNQAVLFFVVFHLISSLSQMLFRNVYTFRQSVISGNFDLILSKPFNPLFRVVFGGFDFIDLVTIPPLIAALVYAALPISPNFYQVVLFILLLVNSLFISFSLHTFVISLSIITLEIDHMVMIYRDLETIARFPLEVYGKKVAFFLTYLIPLGIMISFPAKVLLGLLSPIFVIMSIIFGFVFFFVSIRFWNFALKKYTSASS